MYNFEYHRPTSLAEVVSLLGQKEDAKLLAGGMTLLPTMKQRLAAPAALIDLSGVGELRGIRRDGDRIVIGAMTTHEAVSESPEVREAIAALAKLASWIGDQAVRNCGTIGGSIANNDPAADYPAAVLALDATVKTNKREIKADDFFTGLYETALQDDEIVTEVSFPIPEAAGWVKFRNLASRYAIVAVMVAKAKRRMMGLTGGGVRVAVTGAAPCVFRVTEMEEALARDFLPNALDGIRVPPDGLNGDLHASKEYRAHLVTVMAKRAVEECR